MNHMFLSETSRRLFVIVVGCFTLLLSCSRNQKPTGGILVNDKQLCEDLKIVGSKRVYFGHQSVGNNLLDGLKDIQSACSDSSLKVRNLAKIEDRKGPFFAESMIGQNTEPIGKCEAFAAILKNSTVEPFDLALMKFCYVDFNPGTNVNQVFEAYCTMVDSLKRALPHTTIVHVTTPLTAETAAWKRFVKKILGRSDDSQESNVVRAQFNILLTDRFKGEPIFDLAKVESTFPNGTRNTSDVGGKEVYSLVKEFTDDGGHLNRQGRVVAAREMLRVLAAAARTARNPRP